MFSGMLNTNPGSDFQNFHHFYSFGAFFAKITIFHYWNILGQATTFGQTAFPVEFCSQNIAQKMLNLCCNYFRFCRKNKFISPCVPDTTHLTHHCWIFAKFFKIWKKFLENILPLARGNRTQGIRIRFLFFWPAPQNISKSAIFCQNSNFSKIPKS